MHADRKPDERVSVIVVMGVSGVGKTTVGRLLAERLGWRFIEADDHHPPANVAKLAAGIPLDDADRAPWLHLLTAMLERARQDGERVVLACSALKRAYREVLRGGHEDVLFAYLAGEPAVIRRRMAGRTGHYMPLALLDSQLETLEPPAADERALTLDASEPPEVLAERVIERLGAAS
jgi:carbohydrate kinase (thermoresistant glucokinase family)